MYSLLNRSVTLNCKENLILLDLLIPLLWTKNSEKIRASPNFTFIFVNLNLDIFLINFEFFFAQKPFLKYVI